MKKYTSLLPDRYDESNLGQIHVVGAHIGTTPSSEKIEMTVDHKPAGIQEKIRSSLAATDNVQ